MKNHVCENLTEKNRRRLCALYRICYYRAASLQP